MRTTGLDHPVLTVADLAVASDFCAWVLGMTPQTFESGGLARGAPTFGMQKSNVHQADRVVDASVRHATPGSADLCPLTDVPIDDVVADLARSRVAVVTGPVRRAAARGPLRSVYLYDPDENLIEVSNALDDPVDGESASTKERT